MAVSRFQTTQRPAEEFIKSAGAVLSHLPRQQVCLVQQQEHGEWLLAKGRRNISERQQDAALREAVEETGYACDLLRLTMVTRAPPAVETGHCPDVPRKHEGVSEPFLVTCRYLDGGKCLKLIWWFIAAIRDSDESGIAQQAGVGEDQFMARLFDFEEALTTLTYELDRDVLRRAISIVEQDALL